MALRTTTLPGPWSTDKWPAAAALTTSLTGANNDLKFTSPFANASGNSVTIAYVVAGTNTALSVSVTGSAITVNVATNGAGAASSTAAQVRDAVNQHVGAGALVTAANASGNDGTGVVVAMAATPLTGGVSHSVAQGGGWGSAKRVKA